MSMLFLLPGMVSSLYQNSTHPGRLSWFKHIFVIKPLPVVLTGLHLTFICSHTTTWPFLYNGHLSCFFFFFFFFELELVAYVSEIISGMQNIQWKRWFFTSSFSFPQPLKQYFHIKVLRNLERKENFLRHWHIWRKFCSENYLIDISMR